MDTSIENLGTWLQNWKKELEIGQHSCLNPNCLFCYYVRMNDEIESSRHVSNMTIEKVDFVDKTLTDQELYDCIDELEEGIDCRRVV